MARLPKVSPNPATGKDEREQPVLGAKQKFAETGNVEVEQDREQDPARSDADQAVAGEDRRSVGVMPACRDPTVRLLQMGGRVALPLLPIPGCSTTENMVWAGL